MRYTRVLILAALLVLAASNAALAAMEGITVDQAKKEIAVLCDINGKYFSMPTVHTIVSLKGKNAEKSIFRTKASEIDFYRALVSIGAKPGKNMDMDAFKAGESRDVSVRGDMLDVYITWPGMGKELLMEDVIIQKKKQPMDFRFSDNLAAAEKLNTGCLLCFFSCPAGIVGDLNYPYYSGMPYKFYADEKLLPKDGSPVTIIFRLRK